MSLVNTLVGSVPAASELEVFKVKVTLLLTVSHSVSQYILVSSPNLGYLTRIPPPPNLLFCLFGAPSLTRGLVCHLSVFVSSKF
jgi:hypothetical protein